METFAPRGNIHGPILPQFVLQMPMTFGAKTMYAILCDYAADKDHCWPSQATLAKRLSCSISSVKNYLAELVKEKLIFIKREQYRSSVYYILRPESCSEKQDTNSVHQQSKPGCDEAISGSLTTLNKQGKERDSPLSPHAAGETASVPVRRTSNAPAAGGVSPSLPDFESVWMLYPKKEAKGFARMAWLKLSRSGQLPSLPELHAAIRRFAASEGWQCEQGRFVPQMGNWLRGQRWLDPLPLAEQAEAAQNQSALRALRVREEREQRLKEQKDAERARLRPLFDAFAAKFPPLANDAMPFGIWQYLHSQNRAPSADDVPPENSLGIIEFLNEFKRRRQTADFRTKRQPLNARREAGTPCRSVGDILKNLPVSRFFPGGEQPERAAFAYA
ncbi:helix-turn-helix domain-containing protein [uncultured Desulfovibrio sp.]|uniref:helix-turn-helix domain-containing protein n=1 Tax=uncultured Desulfovibrio sp. TaxID=167968 RepID=UPI00262F8407|nr:helix-turn-helix domain-containing protein [uncultured Desulfovibrio sp.]